MWMDTQGCLSEAAGYGGSACAFRKLRQEDCESEANGHTVKVSQRGKGLRNSVLSPHPASTRPWAVSQPTKNNRVKDSRVLAARARAGDGGS